MSLSHLLSCSPLFEIVIAFYWWFVPSTIALSSIKGDLISEKNLIWFHPLQNEKYIVILNFST